ncbi:hypothetical protein QUF63_01945 [Anaerolineales bacterium HSG25]|nr:hypothetical protein [Anaerolineales bacterium HSG25]
MSITTIEKSDLQSHMASAVQAIVQDWNTHIEQELGSVEFGLTYEDAYQDVCKTLVEARAKAYDQYSVDEYHDEYRLGFCMGYTESALDTHWKGKYWMPHQKIYRYISWLKAIYSYLEFDARALLAVSRLHHHIMVDDAGQYGNLDNFLHDVSNDLATNHVPIPIPKEKLTENLKELDDLIFAYILDAINTHIDHEKEKNWLRRLSSYLPEVTLGKFVNDYIPQ